MCEEKEGVMRNAMTTRAPGGAKNTLWIVECVGQRLREICGAVGVGQAVASQVGASCSLVSSIFPALEQSTGGIENFDDPNTDMII